MLIAWWVVPAALLLDFAIGDPRSRWHPVCLIGHWANLIERLCRQLFGGSHLAGCIAWLAVLLPPVAIAASAWVWLGTHSPGYADVFAAAIIYMCIAPRSLAEHAFKVERALKQHDLAQARQAVGMVVGRDTANLDEPEVARAAVEAVAESTGDGVLSPLFWGVVGGPIGAIGYRAINTLDSMWGHRDERYGRFGWAAARADDVANYLPARLGVPLVSIAALVLRLRPGAAFMTAWRDGRLHSSPNAGLGEAAFAGALSVRLGGTNSYDGEVIEGHYFGRADKPLDAKRVRAATWLMLVASMLSAAVVSIVLALLA